MPFEMGKFKESIGKLNDAKESLANLGLEKARELLAQINSLLQLLQMAGYGINNVDLELGLSPKVTIKLASGAAVKDDVLAGIVRDHADEQLVVGLVSSLIQANRLRNSITLETIELAGTTIMLTTTPTISLQWRSKAA
jgi:hypothetical protein